MTLLCHSFTAADVSALQLNIGEDDVTDAARTAVVGSNLIVSCSDGSAQWTFSAIPVMNEDNTRVYTAAKNMQTDLHFEPFQTSDAGNYSCTRGNETATVTLGRGK